MAVAEGNPPDRTRLTGRLVIILRLMGSSSVARTNSLEAEVRAAGLAAGGLLKSAINRLDEELAVTLDKREVKTTSAPT